MVSDKQIEAAREIIPWVPAATVRAALLAAERAAWEDISTAPRDGTIILVEGGPVEWRGYGWFSLKAQRALQWHPTHWRPLHAAPEAPDAE